jgi:glycosyltransferase involved in cell wall biosynthesis
MVETTGSRAFRILLLSYHSPTNVISAGGFRRTYEILKRTPAGIEVFVVDNSPSFLRTLDNPSVQVVEYRVPGFIKRLERRFFIIERLLEWLFSLVLMIVTCLRLKRADSSFDLVYVPSSEIFPSLLAGLVAKYLFKKNLVVCNMNIDIYSFPIVRLLVRLHNRADRVIALSEDLRDKLRHIGADTGIEVNGAGIDSEYIARVLEGTPPDKRYDAVFVGRTTIHKGSLDLVRIWSIVTGEFPEARLLMIGSLDPVNQSLLYASIDRHGLQESILVRGTVAEDTKYALIKASKLCVFPSYVEEWGIVPQEALACGLPVVLYDLPVYKENVRSCDAVFAIEVGDYRGIAEETIRLLTDDEYLQFGAAGPEFVARYDWDSVSETEFRILTEVGCDSGTGILSAGLAAQGD